MGLRKQTTLVTDWGIIYNPTELNACHDALVTFKYARMAYEGRVIYLLKYVSRSTSIDLPIFPRQFTSSLDLQVHLKWYI